MSAKNRENLIPFNRMDKKKHKAISAKGGKRSAEVRKERIEKIKEDELKNDSDLATLESLIRQYATLVMLERLSKK